MGLTVSLTLFLHGIARACGFAKDGSPQHEMGVKRFGTEAEGIHMSLLTDDLVVEILSRLPLKSFCRFKCVCKSWLAISSDPHYRQKLPRTPVGYFYQLHEDGTCFHLARLPSSDKEIDTTLSFVPCYEHLQLIAASNGLLLCYHGGITSYFADVSHVIVCNPATQEWMSLPNTQPGPTGSDYDLMLFFDPSWSEHFYVFSFEIASPDGEVSNEVMVFFSEDSTWYSCRCESELGSYDGQRFLNGVLYAQHLWEHILLAIDAPDICTQWLNQRIIQLPGFPHGPGTFDSLDGCLSHSSGVLCYAQQELDGCMIRIWSLEDPDKWVVKQRLSMNNVFGRDLLLRTNHEGLWYFDYEIEAFHLQRDLIILADRITHEIILFSTSTGKASKMLKIPRFSELYRRLFYVPFYCKFPALISGCRGLR